MASIFMIHLSGCVSARALKIHPGKGGVIAVDPGFKSINNPEVRAKAMEVMQSNCGVGKVIIDEEGYVKVGEQTSVKRSNKSSTKESAKAKGVGYTNYWGTSQANGRAKARSETRERENATKTKSDISEWQIIYRCEK